MTTAAMVCGCVANTRLRHARKVEASNFASSNIDLTDKSVVQDPSNVVKASLTAFPMHISETASSRVVEASETMPDDQATDTSTFSSQSIDLALNQVIYSAIREHPFVRAQWESTVQARADAITVSLLPNPELFTDGQLLPLTRPFTVTRQGGPPQQDAILTYPIDWYIFGKRFAAMQTAHAAIHVAQYEYEDMIRRRVVEATETFYTLAVSQELEKISSEIVTNFEKLEKITEQAVSDGGKPAVELKRIRLDLLAAKQHLAVVKSDRQVAQARVASLMGSSDLSQSIRADFDFDLPLTQPGFDRESAFQFAAGNRADVQRLRWLSTQSCQNTILQKKLAKPTLAPSFGYTRQYQEKAIGFPDANSWSAALTMSLPLHDRNQGNISRSISVQRQVNFQIESLRIDIREEIETTFAQLEASEAAARSVAEEQLQLAAQVRESIIRSFETGGRPLIDVLDAQKNYRETLSLYYSTRSDYWKALSRLYCVVGQQTPVQHSDS